jgi:hypothetical protein
MLIRHCYHIGAISLQCRFKSVKLGRAKPSIAEWRMATSPPELPQHTVMVDAEVLAAISAMPGWRRACGPVRAAANGEVQFASQVPEPVLTVLTADRAQPDDSYNEMLQRLFLRDMPRPR